MKTRLLFIITGLSTGGAETMLLKILQHIDRSKFTATVISLTTKGDLGQQINKLNIPVIALGMRPALPNPWLFFRLVRIIRRFRPDILQTWLYHADLIGGLAARVAGVSAVVWGVRHCNLDKELNKWHTLRVVDACSLLSSYLPKRILLCSEKARRVHIEAGYNSGKMLVIPNGFNLNSFYPDAQARWAVRDALGLAPETPLAGLIARDDPQKNILGMVSAAEHIHQRNADIHFIFAGSGLDDSNTKLVAAIAKANLGLHVHLLGKRDDVPCLMAALDVLASPSHGEAFPNVLGEAMACGVPCVVTDAGDSAAIVGETGKVVPAGNMNAMAEKILAVLELPKPAKQQLNNMARARIHDKYDISKVVSRYEIVYHSLLPGSSD